MELLFVYDDKVAEDNDGNFYTSSTFSQTVFDRYLQHFEHITLIARKADDTADCSKMNRLNSDKVSVKIIPNLRAGIKDYFSPVKRKMFKDCIRREITPERAVIIRVPSDSGAVAAKYCKKIGKPYLTEAVGCPWDSYRNHSVRGKIMAPFEFLRQRQAVRNADYTVYVTNSFLQRRYPTKGIAAAISDVELQVMDDDVLGRRLESIENRKGRLIIGTAAAIDVPYKGQRYVIEALAKRKAEGDTGYEYHLAGGGDRSFLANLAKSLEVEDQVIFEGSLPHDKMFDWLDGIDLYIQPSTVEAMPRALIEAMSRGLPAIASKVGGMPELVDNEAIFEKRDAEAISEKIKALNKVAMKTMAEVNFVQVKPFQKELLKEKRSQFYADFADLSKRNQ